MERLRIFEESTFKEQTLEELRVESGSESSCFLTAYVCVIQTHSLKESVRAQWHYLHSVSGKASAPCSPTALSEKTFEGPLALQM